MKILFVTHDVSIYGASKSLQLLLKGLASEGVRTDLVVNRKFIGAHDQGEIRSRFDVDQIHEFFLPVDLCYRNAPKLSWKVQAKNFVSRLMKSRFDRFLKARKYDVVCLNSLVLHQLITADHHFFVIAREVYDGVSSGVVSSINKAKGVIFIDAATRNALHSHIKVPSVTMENPFDMSNVKSLTRSTLPYGTERRTVIAMIGQISENKGSAFVIDTFLKAKPAHSLLLIVGNGEPEYLALCERIAAGNPSVFFHGEESEIDKVYAVADYVIRGEDFPCVGRTVLEGLYSGCRVILPAENTTGFDNAFRDRVFPYQPRNENQLCAIFSSIDGSKVMERTGHSNVSEYAEQFLTLVKSFNVTA